MKLGSPAPKGSFGIPEELKQQMDDARKAKEAMPPPEEPVLEEEEIETKPAPAMVQPKDPVEILREIGIEPKDEDFHSLVFRGYVEKTVVVTKNPFSGKEFTAKMRTLTAEELDYVDELVAEEMESIKMTQIGYEARRAMTLLSFGVTELDGNPLTKNVYDESKTFLPKETAQKRRKVLSKLSPTTIDLLMGLHNKIVTSYSLLMSGNRNDLLKK